MEYQIFISIVNVSANLKNIDIDIDKEILENIDIDKEVLKNIDIDIDKEILQNIDIVVAVFSKSCSRVVALGCLT